MALIVSNANELYAALAKAQGGETILLEAGNYGTLNLSPWSSADADFASTVTIRSEDPLRPAVFTGASVGGASNLTLEDIKFDYRFSAGTYDPFSFSSCTNLVIRDCTFDGDVASGLSAADNGYPWGRGLAIQNSTGTTIVGCEIYGFGQGISMWESSGTTIRDNDIHGIRVDGMTFAEMSGLLIEGNHIHDFRGSPLSGDHRDMIQFWTTGTDQPTRDVVIRGNVLDIGEGSWTQTIFMRNELVDTGQASFGAMAYRNILIEDNLITNAHLHGITVGETDGLIIRRNSVLHADGEQPDGADHEVEIPRINLSGGSVDVRVVDNLTPGIAGWTGQSGWTVDGNTIVQDQDPLAPGFYRIGDSGADLLSGGDGNDLLLGRAGGDKLYGKVGRDRLFGGAGADSLAGAAGRDLLDGGSGGDRLEGGAGSDLYRVSGTGDRVVEAAGAGIDTVRAAVDLTLAAFVENLVLTGSASLDGEGNGLGNRMIGNEAGNRLWGGGGRDVILGRAGADTLLGGRGQDRIEGGAGTDNLAGGAGDDVFVFASRRAAGDRIADFHNAAGDDDRIRIDASSFGGGLEAGGRLDASLFDRANDSALSGPAERDIRFIFEVDATRLWFDANGSDAGGLRLVADLQAGASLGAGDIWLV